MAGEKKKSRTVHGQQRHRGGDRPTAQAFQDKENPVEVYHREMAAWSTSEETAERTFLKGMLILPASEWQSVPVKEK